MKFRLYFRKQMLIELSSLEKAQATAKLYYFAEFGVNYDASPLPPGYLVVCQPVEQIESADNKKQCAV